MRKPQQSVTGDQGFDEAAHAVDEILLAFAIVVDVDIDIGNAGPFHFRQCVQKLRPIFFLRVVKSVLRCAPGGIGLPPCDFRPVFHPEGHSLGGSFVGGMCPEWLPMIGNCYPHAPSAGRGFSGQAVADIAGKPELRIARQGNRHGGPKRGTRTSRRRSGTSSPCRANTRRGLYRPVKAFAGRREWP